MFTIRVKSDWSVDVIRLIEARDAQLETLLDVTLPIEQRMTAKGHAEAVGLQLGRSLDLIDDDDVNNEVERQAFLRTQLDVDYPATNYDGEREESEGWLVGLAEALSILRTHPIPD